MDKQFSTVTKYFRQYKKYLIFGSIAVILSNSLLLLTPYISKLVFDVSIFECNIFATMWHSQELAHNSTTACRHLKIYLICKIEIRRDLQIYPIEFIHNSFYIQNFEKIFLIAWFSARKILKITKWFGNFRNYWDGEGIFLHLNS